MIDKVVLLCLLCLASADIDKDFCTKNFKKIVKGKKVPDLPTIPKKFSITFEQTNNDTKTVEMMLMDYSEPNNQFHMERIKNDAVIDIWMDTDRNSQLVHQTGQEGCSYLPLNTTFLNRFFKLRRKPGGEFTIAPPAAILGIERGGMFHYIGSGKTRAGMPADLWQSCLYTTDTDATALITLYFAQKNMKLPLKSGGMVLTAETMLSSPNSNAPKSINYDYVNLVPLDDTNKLLPKPMYCLKEPKENPSISIPTKFAAKLEIIKMGEPGELYPTPKISNVKIVYDATAKRFMTEVLAFTEGDYGVIIREVNDFRQGLTYTIDLLKNNCTIEAMFQETSAINITRDGSATMKTPKEYFKFDQDYKYIGQRYHAERGIDCDVYVGKTGTGDKESVIIWYIASYFWKTSVMKYIVSPDAFLPVSMEVVSDMSHEVINYYEFFMLFRANRMDNSMCFDWNDNMLLVAIYLQGNFLSVYYNHADDFIDAFKGNIGTIFGGEIDTSRILVKEVNPTGPRSMVITFTILGLPKVFGNAPVDAYHWPAKDIFTKIKKYVNKGKMAFRVPNVGDAIYGDVKAISIDLAVNGTFPVSTAAPSSGKTDNAHGLSHVTDAGKTDHTHGASHVTHGGKTNHTDGPSHVTDAGKTDHTHGSGYVTDGGKTDHTHDPGHGTDIRQGSTSKNTGYFPGEMAGLAFGSIAIGVLVFIAVFFLHRRFYGRFRTANGDGGMVELSTQS